MKRPSKVGNVQPMLTAIAKTAARLCEANDALIFLVEGDKSRLVARHGRLGTLRRLGQVLPLTDNSLVHRAIVERRTIHVRDVVRAARTPFLYKKARVLNLGIRTYLATPLLRDGAAIGAIAIRRTKVRPFAPKQVALLKTFADQAALAIENARLSQALDARNAELTESLEQQTATAEILRVISTSPTDLQIVLDTVVTSAARFCGAYDATMFQLDGGSLRLAAHHGPIPASVGRHFPVVRGASRGVPCSSGRPFTWLISRPRLRSLQKAAPSLVSWASGRC